MIIDSIRGSVKIFQGDVGMGLMHKEILGKMSFEKNYEVAKTDGLQAHTKFVTVLCKQVSPATW